MRDLYLYKKLEDTALVEVIDRVRVRYRFLPDGEFGHWVEYDHRSEPDGLDTSPLHTKISVSTYLNLCK